MTGLPPDGDDPWTVRGSRVVLDNPFMTIEEYDVRHRAGRESAYAVLRAKRLAVGVLPLFEDGRVALVGQWRFPFARYSWEMPEGGSDPGEDAETAAFRELVEETGLRAARAHTLFDCDLSNMMTDERAVGFLAWDLTRGASAPEDVEELACAEIPFEDALAAVSAGRIRDSLTILALLSAEAEARRGRLPEAACDALKRGGARI